MPINYIIILKFIELSLNIGAEYFIEIGKENHHLLFCYNFRRLGINNQGSKHNSVMSLAHYTLQPNTSPLNFSLFSKEPIRHSL